MTIEFIDNLPDDLILKPVLISGATSVDYSNHTYLKLSDADTTSLYQIKYEVHCSPFKEALTVDNLLAVGHEEYFYLFDKLLNKNILQLKMNGYFGHLYFDTGHFYIADANGIHCIDKTGKIRWANSRLAVDGVIVNQFTDNRIIGSGELDPPDGWEDFILDKETGIDTK